MRHDKGYGIILFTLWILALGCICIFCKNAVIFFMSPFLDTTALTFMISSLMFALAFIWLIILLIDNQLK